MPSPDSIQSVAEQLALFFEALANALFGDGVLATAFRFAFPRRFAAARKSFLDIAARLRDGSFVQAESELDPPTAGSESNEMHATADAPLSSSPALSRGPTSRRRRQPKRRLQGVSIENCDEPPTWVTGTSPVMMTERGEGRRCAHPPGLGSRPDRPVRHVHRAHVSCTSRGPPTSKNQCSALLHCHELIV